MTDYGPYVGIGRITIYHRQNTLGNPIGVSRANARRIIDKFLASRCSAHSPSGNTLWVVTDYCFSMGISYSVDVRFFENTPAGYFVMMT